VGSRRKLLGSPARDLGGPHGLLLIATLLLDLIRTRTRALTRPQSLVPLPGPRAQGTGSGVYRTEGEALLPKVATVTTVVDPSEQAILSLRHHPFHLRTSLSCKIRSFTSHTSRDLYEHSERGTSGCKSAGNASNSRVHEEGYDESVQTQHFGENQDEDH